MTLRGTISSGAMNRCFSQSVTHWRASSLQRGAPSHPSPLLGLSTGAGMRKMSTGTDSRDEFWRKIPMWKDIRADQFFDYKWSSKESIFYNVKSKGFDKLKRELESVIPDQVPRCTGNGAMQTRAELLADIEDGITRAAMSVRITPYIFARVDWEDPANCPIFKQYMPLGSILEPDHPFSKRDSLDENGCLKAKGLIIHRYPGKALFFATDICSCYCQYCTRDDKVGPSTLEITKVKIDELRKTWPEAFRYIASTPELKDIVVSGGDLISLPAAQLREIGDQLISIPNVENFRFASKGLAVCPTRFLDPNDEWCQALIDVSDKARKAGKRFALHTHFNHPNEISWVTRLAAKRLFEANVKVRNQTVLLRGINDDASTMGDLIRTLAYDLKVDPYYVYQCDMVKYREHYRTPLKTIRDIEQQLSGTMPGHFTPKYVVDLPGGGGKQLAQKGEYDEKTGVATFAPTSQRDPEKLKKVYRYYDPGSKLDEASADTAESATRGKNSGPFCPAAHQITQRFDSTPAKPRDRAAVPMVG